MEPKNSRQNVNRMFCSSPISIMDDGLAMVNMVKSMFKFVGVYIETG